MIDDIFCEILIKGHLVAFQENKLESEIHKQYFLSADFLALKAEAFKTSGFTRYYQSILDIYKSCCYFPDSKVIERFIEIGFSKNEIIWFISLDDIFEEVKLINHRGLIKIEMERFMLILTIIIYSKIFNIIYKKIDVNYDRPFITELKNLEKRKKYGKTKYNTQVNDFEKSVGKSIDHFTSQVPNLFPNYDAMKLLRRIDRGKMKDFYFGETFRVWALKNDSKTSDRKVYIELYPLFRLIFPDSNLPEPQSIDPDNEGYRTVEKYKASRVRAILGVRKS